MAEERPQIEALNAWFRRRQRLWWGKYWPLSVASLLLMLGAAFCYIAFNYSPHYTASSSLQISFDSYLLILAPAMVLLLLTHHAIHLLPTQDIAMAFGAPLLYRTALMRAYNFALVPFSVLWLLPMISVCIDMANQMGHIDSFLVLIFVQQLVLVLAALEFQIYLVIHLSITSFTSAYVFIPLLLVITVNLPLMLLLFNPPQSVSEELTEKLLQWSLVAASVLLMALFIRTATLPRGFSGYWDMK